jgi:hypothetical protein
MPVVVTLPLERRNLRGAPSHRGSLECEKIEGGTLRIVVFTDATDCGILLVPSATGL